MNTGIIALIIFTVFFVALCIFIRKITAVIREKSIRKVESCYGPSNISSYYNNWFYTILLAIIVIAFLLCIAFSVNFIMEKLMAEFILVFAGAVMSGILFAIFFIISTNGIMLVYDDKVVHRSFLGRQFKEYYFTELRAFTFPQIGGKSGSSLTLFFTNGVISTNSMACGTYQIYEMIKARYGGLEGINMVNKFFGL